MSVRTFGKWFGEAGVPEHLVALLALGRGALAATPEGLGEAAALGGE